MKCAACVLALTVSVGMIAGCGFSPVASSNVVFMGDSITYLWGQASASPLFPQHPSWIDAGVSGNTSGQMVNRFETDVIARHPTVVVILAGTNDVYPGWTLCGGSQSTDSCDNIMWMVSQAEANGIQPILATIPPWGCKEALCAPAEFADATQTRYQRINTLNEWIRTYGKQQGLVVLDYWAVLVAADRKTYIPSMTLEGVHPNASGFDVMSPLVEQALAR